MESVSPETIAEIEAIEITPTPPCSWGTPQDDGSRTLCGRPSTELLAARCGHGAYLCDEHAERQRETFGTTKRVTCVLHGSKTHYEWITLA